MGRKNGVIFCKIKRKIKHILNAIIRSNLFYMFAIAGTILMGMILMLMLIGCVKTIQVKTDTISNLEYIEPQQCQMRTINKINYTTTIQGDNIVISNENMGALLNNILDYKQAVKEYQQCSIINEEYYKQIINSILK
jgi:hypothetical protein